MSEHLYIVGHPVAHSKSPAMYNALYQQMGLDWYYETADLLDDAQAQAFFATHDYLSCNVTTPYKQVACAAATIPAASAKLAGGANVLVRVPAQREALIGYNVDGKGCVGYLELSGVSFADAYVVVCGTGPTSLAILHAAAEAGASVVTLLGRKKSVAKQRIGRYLDEYRELLSTAIPMPAAVDGHASFAEAYEHTTFQFGDYAGALAAIRAAHIIIDATPLGMQIHDSAPFDVEWLQKGQVVMDVVYGHGTTSLVAGACARGAQVFDGTGMLVCQAVDTAEILFDICHVDNTLSRQEMFDLMFAAAGFSQGAEA